MKKICVLGSINIDLVTKIARFPQPGETLEGISFNTYPGGKGANQAVAAGRLGADVTFLGKTGNDAFGEMAISTLRAAHVNTSYIERENTSTGIAVITVNADGENTILYVPGANGIVDVAYVEKNRAVINEADILMLQLEIPIETVEWAAAYARKKNKAVLLDPAPARHLSAGLLKNCTVLTPNETELGIVTDMKIIGEESVRRAADWLAGQGVSMVIHKCGDRGAYLLTDKKTALVAGYKVDCADTTAAGDSFNAGLAVSLARGADMLSSIKYANAVGAMSVTKMGAQSAMPTRQEVEEFLNTYQTAEGKK